VHAETDRIAHRSDPPAAEPEFDAGFEAGVELDVELGLELGVESVVGGVAVVDVPPAAPSVFASADVSSAIASSVRFA
jgi:hypothetical protein